MKPLCTLVAALFCSGWLFAQNGTLRLSGWLHDKKAVVLHISDGLDANKKFSVKQGQRFVIAIDSLPQGFYQTSLPAMLYLKPGFDLTIRPAGEASYTFSGAGALENNSLQEARNALPRFIPVDARGQLTQTALLLEPAVLLQKLDAFLAHGKQLFARSSDTLFVHCAAIDLELSTQGLLGNYLVNYGYDLKKKAAAEQKLKAFPSNHPRILGIRDSIMRPARIKTMSFSDQQLIAARGYQSWKRLDEVAFRSLPAYRAALGNHLTARRFLYLNLKEKPSPEAIDIAALKAIQKEVHQPAVRDYYTHQYLKSVFGKVTDSARLQQYYAAFAAGITDGGKQAAVKALFDKAMAVADGRQAPPFRYGDVSGRWVSLDSLRGKWVYIDVWATWCRPCIAEIPALKKLAAAFAGKNIRFVSISVDEPEDRQKWQTFVQKNSLGGLQLFAGEAFAAAFVQQMQIDAIPRFILIDPAGRIVSGNARRPSEKALREQLDALVL